jgi:hypothetical protein
VCARAHSLHNCSICTQLNTQCRVPPPTVIAICYCLANVVCAARHAATIVCSSIDSVALPLFFRFQLRDGGGYFARHSQLLGPHNCLD